MLKTGTTKTTDSENFSGLFFAKTTVLPITELTLEKNHEDKNGSVCLRETLNADENKKTKILTVEHKDKDKIINLMKKLKDIDENIIKYSYPTHYRQPRFTITMSCSHQQRENIWKIIKAELSDINIPEDIQLSSYSRAASPCTSPMSSPRIRSLA